MGRASWILPQPCIESFVSKGHSPIDVRTYLSQPVENNQVSTWHRVHGCPELTFILESHHFWLDEVGIEAHSFHGRSIKRARGALGTRRNGVESGKNLSGEKHDQPRILPRV